MLRPSIAELVMPGVVERVQVVRTVSSLPSEEVPQSMRSAMAVLVVSDERSGSALRIWVRCQTAFTTP